MNLFNLVATLTLDNKQYEKGLQDSSKSASSFASKVGVAFKTGAKIITGMATAVTSVATALVSLATKTISFGDDIDKTSQKLGLSADVYQKWKILAEQSGTTVSALQMGIRQLTKFTNDLSEGQGEALLTLQKLGIGYEDFMNMSFETQLYTIVNALQGVETQTDKVTIAQSLLGSRTYQELLPLLNMEQGSIDDLFQSYEDLGLIISDDVISASAELSNQFTVLKTSMTVLATGLVQDLYPSLLDITDGLVAIGSDSDYATEKLSNALSSIIETASNKIPELLKTISGLALKLIDAISSNNILPSLATALIGVIGDLLIAVIPLLPKITNMILQVVISLTDAILKLDWGTILISLFQVLSEVIFKQIPSFLTDLIKSLIKNLPKFIMNLVEALPDILVALIEGVVDYITNSITNIFSIVDIISKIIQNTDWNAVGKKLANVGIRIANAIIEGLNKLANFTIPEFKIGTWKIWDTTEVHLFTIPKIKELAKGGMLDTIGTFYRAGENGAEIVAQGKYGTGVANVEQIAEAVEVGQEKTIDAIQKATLGVVNGILSGLSVGQSGSDTDKKIIVKIGEKEFNAYLLQAMNSVLNANGRKTLNTITAY